MTGARRGIAVGAVVLAGLLAVLAVAAGRAAAVLGAHRDELLAAVASFIGRPVEAGSLSVSWWPLGVVAHDVSIPDDSPYGPGNLAHADEAHFEIALLPLLRGSLTVTEVRLQAPVLRIVRGADGGWNFERQGEPALVPERAPGREWPVPTVSVDTVRIRNARVSYRDRGIAGLGELEVKAVNLRLRHRDDAIDVDFNAQAFGGPAENVSGVVRISDPFEGGKERGEVLVTIEGSQLQGAILPEVVGALRGRLPFGLEIGGEIQMKLSATMPAAWPPGVALIDLSVDARAGSLRAASGWIEKRSGAVLEGDFELRAGDYGLAVDGAVLRFGGAELKMWPEPGTTAPDGGQLPMLFALPDLQAATLEQWVPALHAMALEGAVSLDGRVGPGRGLATGRIQARGNALRTTPDEAPISIATASFQAGFSDDGESVVGALRLEDVEGGDLKLERIDAGVSGPVALPLEVRAEARRGTFRAATFERLSMSGNLGAESIELPEIAFAGLGGSLTARGSIAWPAGGEMKFSLDPDWKDLDLDTLLRLADADGVARGRLAGSARLETRAKDVASGLDHLSGTFDVRLTDGAITDLNLAGATLDNLNAVPRLREAVQRRARAQAPGLVAGTSEIASLLLRGRVARRRVELEEIRLASSDYGLEAHGTVSFDGTADLDGTLALSDDASRSLVSESGVLAILAPPGSPVRIPVEIKGTYPRFASSPTSEYVSRVMARAIAPSGSGSAAEMLRRLFGGRSRGEGGAE